MLFPKIKGGSKNVCRYIWKKFGKIRGFFKTPCFCYGLPAIVLIILSFWGINYFPKTTTLSGTSYASIVKALDPSLSPDNYSSKEGVLSCHGDKQVLEAPDLKIINNDCLAAVSAPRIVSNQVLGAILGSLSQQRKEIIEYTIQSGDTLQSIASNFGIAMDTLLWANDLAKSSKIQVGNKVVIPPVDGIIYFVKSGDTIPQIAKTYKAQEEEIISFNQLADEFDLSIGDILIIPNGIMPPSPKPQTAPQTTYLADNYFIFPVQGEITQRLHWYNGVDIGNQCGTPIVAAAAGTVLRAAYDWKSGGGNYITILHKNGVVTWYGHLENFAVNPGDNVEIGQRIGLMGGMPGMAGAGRSTGCHLHFTVIGATNPLAKYPLHYHLKYAVN